MLDKLGAIVEEVGDGLLRWREGPIEGAWEGTQLKTNADIEAHRDLSRALRGLLDIPVVSEEDKASHVNERPERYWLIDPIDGTASLAGGFNGFVLQAALMQGDRPVLAAIRAPALGQSYLAENGAGAFLNGERLRVNPVLERTVLIDNYPEPRGVAAELVDQLPCSGYVESGSISLKICRIADGTADVFVKDVAVRDWDIAAPHLVLTEARGVLVGLDGKPYRFAGAVEKRGVIVARNSALANTLVGFMCHRAG